VKIQRKRKLLWRMYYAGLKPLADEGLFAVPRIPPYATNNAHMFYLVCRSPRERARLIAYLKTNGIQTATHYLSLRKSAYYKDKYAGPELVNCERFVDCLLRLPLYYDLQPEQVRMIVGKVKAFYGGCG